MCIYIYMSVCVCVCVCVGLLNLGKWGNVKMLKKILKLKLYPNKCVH